MAKTGIYGLICTERANLVQMRLSTHFVVGKIVNASKRNRWQKMNDPVSKIREYILGKNPDCVEIMDTTDIIEKRLIDSLQFVEFLMFIEEVANIKIDLESIDVDDFRTIENIALFISGGANRQAESEKR